MIKWPEIITENLWPFAIQLAVGLHNATPNAIGFTPEEFFSGTKQTSRLDSFHPFGCQLGLSALSFILSLMTTFLPLTLYIPTQFLLIGPIF
jgi:hypothetical protein